MCFERDPECLACQDTKEKQVLVSPTLTVSEFVTKYILAKDSLDLSTTDGSLTSPSEPVVIDSDGDCFYCVTGPLAALKGGRSCILLFVYHVVIFLAGVCGFFCSQQQPLSLSYHHSLASFLILCLFIAHHLSAPLSSVVDSDEVITVMDAVWGKNIKRCLKVKYV